MVRSRNKGEASSKLKTKVSDKSVEAKETSVTEESSINRIVAFILLGSSIFVCYSFVQQLTSLTVDDGSETMKDFEKYLRGGGKSNLLQEADEASNDGDDDGIGSLADQKYQGDKVLPWENPFLSRSMKGDGPVYINIDKTEDELLEEALMEQIDEWLRDPPETSAELQEMENALLNNRPAMKKLIKKQNFVENKIREMLAIKTLKSYSYVDRKAAFKLPKRMKTLLGIEDPINPVSASTIGIEAKYAVIADSKATVRQKNANRIIEDALKSIGFEKQTESDSGLPLFLISYGSNCYNREMILKKDESDHILFCVHHHVEKRNREYPYAKLRSSADLVDTLTSYNPQIQNIPVALQEGWKSRYVRKVYRLFDAAEKEKVIRMSENPKYPVWVVVPNKGDGVQQLTTNIDKVAEKYSDERLGCLAYPYNDAPLLWDNKKFFLRSWVVLARSNPLLAYFGGVHVIRSKLPFKSFSNSPATLSKEEKAAIHFPNTAANGDSFDAFSLSDLTSFGVIDLKAIEKQVKKISAYATVGLHLDKRPTESEADQVPKHIRLEHLCMDFTVTDLNKITSIVLESVATDCSLFKGTTPIIRQRITALTGSYAAILLNQSSAHLAKGLPVLINEEEDKLISY
mmetsp:Transcript_12724/g.16474  ORF Transcript_12724/g.16474 Transcript_12724/m.16474 type:complete len:631 (-) Transcript_12724:1723-3615(-)